MVIAYGAGKKANEYLPELLKYGNIDELWDRSARSGEFLCNIPVVVPHMDSVSSDTLIIVFIDDICIRYDISKGLYESGLEHIFGFKEALRLLSSGYTFDMMVSDLSITGYKDTPVLFEYLPVNVDREIGELAQKLEETLRIELKRKPKTSFRPLHMAEDKPHDPFAIFEHLCTYFSNYSCWKDITYSKKQELLTSLITLAQEKKPLERYLCSVYMENSDSEKALSYSRSLCHKYPNSLFINDTFYEVATACKKEGIEVEEPLPGYDLNERFCWCGISFAWCGGDKGNGEPLWGPCFRPNQCSAMPSDTFWSGDEWKEFRKSLLDGSFKYCQKNECTNIVAGWLPKKEDVRDEVLKRLIEGDVDVIPSLEEIHLSYDTHCNLCCPSCRTEFCTNSLDTTESNDRLYENHIKGYVKKAKHLCLSGCGEAMLSPHSNRILRSLSRSEYPDLEVELRTNATSITPHSWEALGDGRKAIRHIAVSIDASEKEIFEKLRYPAKWDQVCDNLRFIQNLRNNNEIDMFEFHVVVQKDNVKQLYDIVKMAMSYDADAITFSRIVNWRGMKQEEYDDLNPFWISNDLHDSLEQEFDRIESLRADLESGKNLYHKKFYISMHFRPDPNNSYDEIRSGRIRIR